jgi:hypothetical protein
VKRLPWINIQPGDIGWDGGTGIFGWVIRRSTGVFGHTWVYHRLLELEADGTEVWETVEAGANGVQVRTRTRPAVKVVRLWRDPAEQVRILDASLSCVGRKYGWGEIGRLALHTVGIRIKGWRDNPSRMICSNHVAWTIRKARPGIERTMPYPPQHIWPQRLAEWADWLEWTQRRAAERNEVAS